MAALSLTSIAKGSNAGPGPPGRSASRRRWAQCGPLLRRLVLAASGGSPIPPFQEVNHRRGCNSNPPAVLPAPAHQSPGEIFHVSLRPAASASPRSTDCARSSSMSRNRLGRVNLRHIPSGYRLAIARPRKPLHRQAEKISCRPAPATRPGPFIPYPCACPNCSSARPLQVRGAGHYPCHTLHAIPLIWLLESGALPWSLAPNQQSLPAPSLVVPAQAGTPANLSRRPTHRIALNSSFPRRRE